MQEILRWVFIISIIIYIHPGLIYPENIYTTSLELIKTNDNQINISWGSSTNKGIFNIYRNDAPIVDSETLSNSTKLAEVYSEGTLDKTIYRFPGYPDILTNMGDFYYIVLPKKEGYEDSDFIPNLNYNLFPVTVIKVNIPEIKKQLTINNLVINTNSGTVRLFWDLKDDFTKDMKFTIYRTTNKIMDKDITNTSYYKELMNEYFFEDTGIQYGITYYYTIIYNDQNVIIPGLNQNEEPVLWGIPDVNVPVYQEIVETEKVSVRDFTKKIK